ncbi:MAG: hypothetical protein JRJ39_05895 [Deltaproteobacteria bacterium]|nr:hypothetical protein [Deltaproteobacteria bacterium]MBW1846993.1 hypothetical protein [Deltaproteobacteria bacterium]MBW1984446.1 hypothetical protein [Deltaproteobacteria bacterium]MBW2181979.1 hypothetical protein [Deltaproteobacteria bacterium]
MKIPEKGMKKEDIIRALKNYKGDDLDWRSGKVLGYEYDPGEDANALIDEVYTIYLAENGLAGI